MQATEELVAQADPSLALGRYRLGPRIGAGGFGTGYEAQDERLRPAGGRKASPAQGRARPPARYPSRRSRRRAAPTSARAARRTPSRGSTTPASLPSSTRARRTALASW